MVLTAKDHHVHFRYRHQDDNGLGSIRAGLHKGMLHGVPQLPEPLHLQIKKNRLATLDNSARDDGRTNGNSALTNAPPREADQRMQDQQSKFVQSEKNLKRQLLQLMQLQNEERAKYNGRNPNKGSSWLGIPISNRYLGQDLLPYPQSGEDEKEWRERMEKRKEELRVLDEKEWKEMMMQYEQLMEDYASSLDESVASRVESSDVNEKPIVSEQQQQNRWDHSQGDKAKSWPSPAEKAGMDATILLKPAFGSHRSSSNAIFVFAEGYDLSIYLAFVESLSNSGYSGDVVISISTEEKLKPHVKEYLMSKNQSRDGTTGLNVVAYEVEWSCFTQSGEAASGSGEGMHHCQMNRVFGDGGENAMPDPREPRPVATARYELYWMWSLQYEEHSWIMLIDARDAWFQVDPFRGLDIGSGSEAGELHLFGENADAVRIGTSNYNRNWLITAYGKDVVEPYFEKPVICSGSTIGHQVAIEAYLRAMVAQFDSTNCKSKGCDQGFHNYLYYSGQLGDESGEVKARGISKVTVHEQGRGIINNLAALRDKPLSEWGLYDAGREVVLNWDGSISAVAHQYDRDKEVNAVVKKKKKLFEKQWKDAETSPR
eukprot:CCRYP_017423-RA/>CCRYP_017423-RA protein AED:0.03 eAED:0.03 QI:394/1/1/1/1/1/3/123/599